MASNKSCSGLLVGTETKLGGGEQMINWPFSWPMPKSISPHEKIAGGACGEVLPRPNRFMHTQMNIHCQQGVMMTTRSEHYCWLNSLFQARTHTYTHTFFICIACYKRWKSHLQMPPSWHCSGAAEIYRRKTKDGHERVLFWFSAWSPCPLVFPHVQPSAAMQWRDSKDKATDLKRGRRREVIEVREKINQLSHWDNQ